MKNIRTEFEFVRITVHAAALILVMSFNTTLAQSNVETTQSATVEFPNQASVPIVLRKLHREMPNVERKDTISEMYGPLVEAANNGNIASARFLGKALRSCISAFPTQAKLDAAISILRNDGVRTYGDERESVQLNHGVDISGMEQVMRRQFELCMGITKEQADSAIDWSRSAAERGDYSALRDVVKFLGETNESFNLWHQAWNQGHVTAAQELVYYYRYGVGLDNDAGPDHYLAYLYQLIVIKIQSLEHGSTATVPGSPGRLISDEYESALTAMVGLLGPGEQQKAEAEAARILADNKNCCLVRRLPL